MPRRRITIETLLWAVGPIVLNVGLIVVAFVLSIVGALKGLGLD